MPEPMTFQLERLATLQERRERLASIPLYLLFVGTAAAGIAIATALGAAIGLTIVLAMMYLAGSWYAASFFRKILDKQIADERYAMKLFCPECGTLFRKTDPWVCPSCKTENEGNDHEYTFLSACLLYECQRQPAGYTCPNCKRTAQLLAGPSRTQAIVLSAYRPITDADVEVHQKLSEQERWGSLKSRLKQNQNMSQLVDLFDTHRDMNEFIREAEKQLAEDVEAGRITEQERSRVLRELAKAKLSASTID